MKRTKQIKVNALRAEIMRLRGEVWKAKMDVITITKGVTDTIELTDKVILAVLKKCGLTEIEMVPDVNDPDTLAIEPSENGYKLKIRATENDNNSEDSTV